MKGAMDWILSRNSIPTTNVSSSAGLLVLRVWIGLFIAFAHGWNKLTAFGERADQFPDPLGVSSPVSLTLTVFAEFFCGLAVAAGLITRGVVIPLIITMLIAAFVIHGDDPWGRKEFALLYAAPFITLLITGPGKYSLDAMLGKKETMTN